MISPKARFFHFLNIFLSLDRYNVKAPLKTLGSPKLAKFDGNI